VSHQDVSTFQFSVNCPCAACVCKKQSISADLLSKYNDHWEESSQHFHLFFFLVPLVRTVLDMFVKELKAESVGLMNSLHSL